MLERLCGHAGMERSWLPRAGAFVVLCSASLTALDVAAQEQEAPRRLSPEVTADVMPVAHTAGPVARRLPPVVEDSSARPLRMAQLPSSSLTSTDPQFGWSMPRTPRATITNVTVRRLPGVQQPAASERLALADRPTSRVNRDLVARRLPPVEPSVRRLPQVEEIASVPSYATPDVAPAPAYTVPEQVDPVSPPAAVQNRRRVEMQQPFVLPQPAPTYSRPQQPAQADRNEYGYGNSYEAETRSTEPKPRDAQPSRSPPQPTSELTAVSQRADALVRRGFTMAGRGAIYSARADFTEALSMIAAAIDRQQRTDSRVEALAQGLRAINEAEQFQPIGSQLAADIDLTALVAAHRTEVLKDELSTSYAPAVSLSEARDRYHDYAAEQLALACADLPVASLALYGLGKVRASQSTERPTLRKIHNPAAMAFFQAAVLVDQQNFRASNELGVLTAQLGRHDEARELLMKSVAVAPTRETWRNLARVHQQLGEQQLAQQAMNEAARTPSMSVSPVSHPAMASSNVRWVSPQAFSQTGPVNVPLRTPVGPPTAAPRPAHAQTSHPGARNASASNTLSRWLNGLK